MINDHFLEKALDHDIMYGLKKNENTTILYFAVNDDDSGDDDGVGVGGVVNNDRWDDSEARDNCFEALVGVGELFRSLGGVRE